MHMPREDNQRVQRRHGASHALLLLTCVLLAALCGAPGLTKGVTDSNNSSEKTDAGGVIEARHVKTDFAVDDFDNAAWRRARAVRITRYWSGADAPAARQ